MREIEFRGKMVGKNGINDWVFGHIQPVFTGMCIMQVCKYKTSSGIELFQIDENTVGQYTGLKDKNGVKIYEGDVLKFSWLRGFTVVESLQVVRFCENAAAFKFWDGQTWSPFWGFSDEDMEVVGNIFDNPEFEERFGKPYREL